MTRAAVLVAMFLASCGGRTEGSSPGPGGADAGLGDVDGASDASAAHDSAGLDVHVLDAATPDAPVLPPDGGAPPSSCNPTTCSGCCSADGTCVLTMAINACGAGGEPCEACPAGDFCEGFCYHWQTDCNPSNCAGCCAGPIVCATGAHDYACGRGGLGCQQCDPVDGTGQCVLQPGGGGLCNGVVSCNAANCPSGCCAGGVCMSGGTNDACGTGGESCKACNGSQQCGMAEGFGHGGQCVDAGVCAPGNCPGCCAGAGCAYGNQDTACGQAGAACVDCTSAGQKCVKQGCQ